MSLDRPYCASATPPGASGLAVIRMAGEDTPEVMDRVFTVLRTADPVSGIREMRGYTAAYGLIRDPRDGQTIDEVVCTYFKAPHSYTGEDLVEISCHGGLAVRREILRVLTENGARPAEPGEFTRRAFLAGKMDLSQAEAVMDVIAADSELALTAAERQLAGSLKTAVRALSADLYRSFAALEMIVEFPEHEDTPENTGKTVADLEQSLSALKSLERSFSQGRILREGMTVVLCGVPNSGKSSLLNRLAGYNRAIVTATPGTTRDTLEVYTSVNGVPVRLIDTAGIRETEDEIEKMGVSRAYEAAFEADLLLWLISPDGDDLEDRSELYESLSGMKPGREFGILASKSDRMTESEADSFAARIEERIGEWGFSQKVRFCQIFSSETGAGIPLLGEEIRRLYDEKGSGQMSGVLLTNSRHYEKVKSAAETLSEGIRLLRNGEGAELACSILRSTMDALGEITGDSVNEELVDTIFSRFCIGK